MITSGRALTAYLSDRMLYHLLLYKYQKVEELLSHRNEANCQQSTHSLIIGVQALVVHASQGEMSRPLFVMPSTHLAIQILCLYRLWSYF